MIGLKIIHVAETVYSGISVQHYIIQYNRYLFIFLLACVRSSDSDGTFETPESTTPVKTAAPPIPPVEQAEPITQPLTSTDTGNH